MKTTLLALLLLSTGLTQAQPVPPEAPAVARRGLLFGAALGPAATHLRAAGTRRQGTDLGLNWKLGYALTPRLALLLNGSAAVYASAGPDRPRKRDFGGVFPAVQYWPGRRVWLLGGLGLGTDAPVFYDVQPEQPGENAYYTGPALIGSVGYELYQRGRLALDLQLRTTYARVAVPGGRVQGFSTGLLLGLNLY